MEIVDVAVIGAGLAGLTCAQQLRQAGYQVIVLEKSRGLGGRAATRRLNDICADHGLRYLEGQGNRSQALIDRLLSKEIIVSWINRTHTLGASGQITADADDHLRYAAPAGISAIAKLLATHLDVRRNQRITAILPTSQGWKFAIESDQASIFSTVARSLVIAIPAPQALALIEPIAESEELKGMEAKLRSVQFDPCITAIAVYPAEQLTNSQTLSWKALTFEGDSILKWIGLDSSKRPNASQPIFVLHSIAAFAEQNFDADNLQAIGQQMLDWAGQRLTPWLNAAELLQVHRWRYAFVKRSLTESCLMSSAPLPIVCCGEWCGGRQVEDALASGIAAAEQLENALAEPFRR